jgi:hypothetical protein
VVQTFLQGRDVSANEHRQVFAVIRGLADHDQRSDPHHFKELKGSDKPLYEFKWDQVRLLAPYDGPRRIVMTHGFRKKSNETPLMEKRCNMLPS